MKLAALFLFIAALLSGCETTPGSAQTVVRFAFPSLSVSGLCANQLTIDDIRQIRELAHGRRDIKRPVDQIVVDHPDEAHVTSGNAREPGDLMTTFDVRKKNGRWFIIEKSIDTGRAIITS